MDQRNAFRVRASECASIRIVACALDESAIVLQLDSLGLDSAGIMVLSAVLPPDTGSELMVGGTVKMTLEISEPAQAFTFSTMIISRVDDDDKGRCYDFRVIDHERIQTEMLPKIRRLFNRRRAYRVQPQPDSPILATAALESSSSRSMRAELIDISATGVRVRLPRDAESSLAKVGRIRLSLTLPGDLGVLQLSGMIRSRILVGADTVYYGVAFDFPSAGARLSDAIQKYVMARQRDECKKGTPTKPNPA